MTTFDLLACVGDPVRSTDLFVMMYVIMAAVDLSHLLACLVVRMSSKELDLMGGSKIWFTPSGES